MAPTVAEIQSLVRDSDKQRFALKPSDPNASANTSTTTPDDGSSSSTDPADWLIRANQGHSIKLESSDGLLRPIALGPAAAEAAEPLPPGAVPVPPTVVHGTYLAFWPAIVAAGGLRPMGRNHVHCSTGLPGDGPAAAAVVSGMRRDAELLVYVDVERSIREAGMRWWVSDNGVVLTEGDDEGGVVPLRFFREVVGRPGAGPGAGVGVLWRDGVKVADLPPGVKGRVPRGKGGAGAGRGRGSSRGGGGGGGGRAE